MRDKTDPPACPPPPRRRPPLREKRTIDAAHPEKNAMEARNDKIEWRCTSVEGGTLDAGPGETMRNWPASDVGISDLSGVRAPDKGSTGIVNILLMDITMFVT